MSARSLPWPRRWLTLLLLAVAPGCESGTPPDSALVELPAGTPLHNPGMGWVLEEFASTTDRPEHAACRGQQPDGSFVDPFPLVDTYEIIASWGEVEPVEGQFDWSRIDEAIAFWNGRFGKRIRLRVSAESLGCYDGPCTEDLSSDVGGIPLWLKPRVPLQVRVDDGEFEMPDYRDPDYQEALQRFLKAYAERYRDNPAVDAVDLRGYGQWGEWHSGHDLDSVEERRQILRWIIDTWYGAWHPTEAPAGTPPLPGEKLLVLSSSYEYRPDLLPAGLAQSNCELPGGYDAFKQNSAYDYALTKRLLTLRRDGVGGVMCPSLDGRLLRESFEQRQMPIVIEFFSWYAGFRANEANGTGYSLLAALDEAYDYHANFVTMPGYSCGLFDPEDFYADPRQLVRQGLASGGMGYRLVLASASFPKLLSPGESWTLRQVWLNRNVGRSYIQYPLRAYLVDACGRSVWSEVDPSFDPRRFLRGNTYEVSSPFTVPADVAPGRYELRVALVDPTTGEPAVRLAIEGRDSEGRYLLSHVVVEGPVRPQPSCQN